MQSNPASSASSDRQISPLLASHFRALALSVPAHLCVSKKDAHPEEVPAESCWGGVALTPPLHSHHAAGAASGSGSEVSSRAGLLAFPGDTIVQRGTLPGGSVESL